MSERLKGKTAIVTAAGQGIGRAVAERLRDEGAVVFASDLNETLFDGLAGVTTGQLDATDQAAIDDYFGNFERVDVLVHCVGYVHQGTIEECDETEWLRSTDITLSSAYRVLRAAIPKMKASGGSIITIGSVASSVKGFPRRAAYGAAKGGVIGLTKAVAADYLKDRIRCNSVCPGTVDSPSLRQRIEDLAEELGGREAAEKFFTSRQPSGRFGQVGEVASLCAYLASDESAFVTGQAINIDGGITI
ncbi:2-keto-3-deoxy-L-fuconate dehydrogenase [Labrenzia sp. THAF82]|uniref:SDR family oxidoreductase n=1 Tax=Labrenzia sp. THAF82 TaxID=2587861 RepID=UPI0012688BFB|nr:SDR family oxidoreductase [Labrenzia sp. THAF82]QFT30488.1 2-keto-3-deoxy-L-fuconate dehydrogenase [Labrenzia sp. THAF82]